jgi:hypothetical protein
MDAWALVRPAATFQFLGANPPVGSAVRLAWRRPLFLAFALGCAVSLIGTGALTARIVVPTTIYWAFVPLAEMAGLWVATRGRQTRWPFAAVIDVFFTGHAAWTLCVLAIVTMIAWSPASLWWMLLTKVAVPILLVVTVWSAYTDYGFFRHVMGAARGAAIRSLLIQRVISWPILIAIFAVPIQTPMDFVADLGSAIDELLR